jgi:hypothetical protein
MPAKAIMTNALPTMAGLKMFMPSPPKTILPIPMATTPAMNPTYQGAVAGSDSPRINPGHHGGQIIEHQGPESHAGKQRFGSHARQHTN